ncbi:MAG TPA: putative LPS assembly protein LptD, partial [Gemmatimonadota bacterium]|nr:putative LPS assembly protein LptD [Gemmatimonadota bacterium]
APADTAAPRPPGVLTTEQREALEAQARAEEERRRGERARVEPEPGEEPEAERPAGEERVDRPRAGEPAPGESPAGRVPPPDALYQRLLEGADTTGVVVEGAPIRYHGNRLVFYPQGEVIVLEGNAQADQGGTSLQADRILFRSREGVVEAFREASVSRGPSKLTADSLFYDRESGAVATFGASVLTEGQSETRGVDLMYDLERRSGRLGGGTTVYEPWILQGTQMSKIGESTYLVEHGNFTTCDLPEPHYRFASSQIKMRQRDVIVASPVVLYFSDVPVFFLPWYVEPITRGRHSGFLRPQIGLNTIIFGSGQERNVQDLGYYYVFGDYADARVSADWYSESRTVLRFDARYALRYEFDGDLHAEQVWNRIDDSTSRLIRFAHDHTISPVTRASVNVNWSNSRSFLRRNSFDPEEILQRAFRSAASYSTRFGWGSLVAGADADFRLDVQRTDYRLPDLRISINQRPLWGSRPGPGPGAGDPSGRSWYQNLQYSASASMVGRLSRAAVDSAGNPVTNIPTDSLGRPLDLPTETVINEQQGRAQFTLSGPLELFGVIKTNPSMSYSAQVDHDQLADDAATTGNGQLNGGLNLSTRFFRIFDDPPGPMRGLRHTVAPSVGFSYSPKPNFWGVEPDDLGLTRERLTASFSLNQDFDVKLPVREGASAAAEEEGEETSEVEATRTINLLSVSNTMAFDIRRHQEEDQLGFGNLNTRITTGLGESFNIGMSMDHELVKQGEARDLFVPFLSGLNVDFTIRQGRTISAPRVREASAASEARAGRGAEGDLDEARQNLAEQSEGFGPWSLSLTHSWTRSRSGESNRQSLGIGAQLLPSSHWSLNYRTNYDITEGTLQGQTLNLVRELHDWQATLGINYFPSEPQDRILVSFAVFLKDVPDLQIPYRVRRE